MKSLHDLARTMLGDLGMACGIDTARDWKTVACRIECEGDEFLTITLPAFCSSFERSLADGVVGDDAFPGFRKRAGLPVFMRGFLLQIFDPSAATVKTDASIQAIFAIRQFTLAFGKILALPCPRRQRAALRAFVQLEEEMHHHGQDRSKERQVGPSPHSCDEGRPEGCPAGGVGPNSDSTRLVGHGFPRGFLVHDDEQQAYDVLPRLGKSRGHSADDSLPHLCGDDSDRRLSVSLRPVFRDGSRRDAWRSLSLVQADADDPELNGFDRVAMHLSGGPVHSAFGRLSVSERDGRGLPAHGPGATADLLRGNEKYLVSVWPERLERRFPVFDWMASSSSPQHLRELEGRVGRVPLLPAEEPPTRVILVPKSSKSPRIIAAELTAHQWIQQAISRSLVEAIESDNLFGPLIGFSDQEPNRSMAREGSLNGELATLDLSDASDRVSLRLVRRLFRTHPYFLDAIESCRALRADVPGFGIIPLAKFATMGSALTFPIEAMVFLAIVVSSIARVDGQQPTVRFIRGLHGLVRVYGDDIIVPARYATTVISDLEANGLKVNTRKSFWTGQFRESCGGDFFRGHDVKPVRLRKPIPQSRKDAAELASLVSFRNQCYEQGLWTTAAWCDKVICRIIRHFPITESTSSLLGRRSYVFSPQAEEVCPDTHVPLVKGCELKVTIPRNTLDGYPALTKWHFESARRRDSDFPHLAEDHLQRSGRPRGEPKLITRYRRPY